MHCTLDALRQAEKIILSKHLDARQDLVWLYGQGFADFRTMKGKAYLRLAPHFPENNYFQDAYDAFSMPVDSQMTTRWASAIAIAQADALRGLGDMNECIKLLERGLHTSVEINSQKRINEASDVISSMPPEWKTEKAVQNLQKDISHALVVVRR